MIAAIVGIAGMLGAIAFASARAPAAAPRRDFGDVELAARVRRLAQTQARIDQLDRMITDLEMCEPGEYHRNFKFDWQSGSENHTFEFWADGDNNTTEDLIYLARRERQKLKRSLLEQIDALR